MRHVYLPDNLTAMQLLDFRECSPLYQQVFHEEVIDHVRSRRYMEALVALDAVFGDGKQPLADQNARALSLVLRGEICRRQGRWVDAVTYIHFALNIMEFQPGSVVKHNEGIAVYTEGLCHICVQSQDKVAQTFDFARKHLVNSEAYWRHAKIPQRVYESVDLVDFMGQLHAACRPVKSGMPAVFLPVYEIRNGLTLRTGVIALLPSQYAVRIELISQIASDIVLLNPEGVTLVSLSKTVVYIALRITELDDSQLGKPGDLLILEVLPEGNQGYTEGESKEVNKLSRTLDVRYTDDGRMIYDAETLRLPGCKWLVSPHLLIRKEAL